MKAIITLILSLILILSFANPVLADSGEARFEEKKVDGYNIKLAFVAGDVQIGHNEIHIQIDDPQGQPVKNALVTIIAELYEEGQTDTNTGTGGMDMGNSQDSSSPAEKPMETVKVDLKAGTEAGEYEGEVELSQAGHWMVTSIFKLEQQERLVEFEIELKKSGPNWYVLSGFFGVIVLFIVAGVLTKRKAAKVLVPEVAN